MLTRTPKPFEDEQYEGYCVRLSELNGFSVFSHFTGIHKQLRWQNPIPDPKIIAEITGHSNNIVINKNETFKQNVNVFGSDVIPNHLIRLDGAFCPWCLEEDGFIRNFVSLNTNNFCIKHGMAFVTYCKHCSAQVKKGRNHLSRCDCNIDYKNSDKIKPTPWEFHLALLIYNAYQRQYSRDEVTNIETRLPHFLQNLTLIELCTIIHNFSRYYQLLNERKPSKNDSISQIAKIFFEGAKSYDNFLTKIFVLVYGRTEYFNLDFTTLGHPPISLSKAKAEFLHVRYFEFLMSKWGSNQLSRVLTYKPHSYRMQVKKSLSFYAAVTVTNIDDVLTRYENDQLVLISPTTTNTGFIVRNHKFDRIPSSHNGMSLRKAAEYMGIGEALLNGLHKAGLFINNYYSDEPQTFCIEDCDLLIDSLLNLKSNVRENSQDGFISWNELWNKVGNGQSSNKLDILKFIFENKIRISLSTNFFKDLMINETDYFEMKKLCLPYATPLKQCSPVMVCIDLNMLTHMKSQNLIINRKKNYY